MTCSHVMLTPQVYHIPDKGKKALCPIIEPIGKDGNVDTEVVAR